MASAASSHYFLGANSPNGFYSLYDWLIDYSAARRVLILKGGAGCGKSSFMRALARRAESAGLEAEYIHCSSDPDSLDGVVIPALGCAAVDGTAPHVVEPRLPGVVDRYIDLGAFYDSDALYRLRGHIEPLLRSISEQYPAAYRCLSAAKSLSDDCFSTVIGLTDAARLDKRCSGICCRELKKTGRAPGCLKKRFYCGITPHGIVSFDESVSYLAGRVYELKSEYGLARLMTATIMNRALSLGYDVVAGYDPLSPEGCPRQVIIPALSLGFTASSELFPWRGPVYRRLLLDSHIDRSRLRECRPRLRECRKMTAALIERATASLSEARALHDRLEALYNPHVDFDGVYGLADKCEGELLSG